MYFAFAGTIMHAAIAENCVLCNSVEELSSKKEKRLNEKR